MRNYLFKIFSLIFIYAYNMFQYHFLIPAPPISLSPPHHFPMLTQVFPFLLAIIIKVGNLTLKERSLILWASVLDWIKNELVVHKNSSSSWLQMHYDLFPHLCCHEFTTKVDWTLKMQAKVKPLSQNYFVMIFYHSNRKGN